MVREYTRCIVCNNPIKTRLSKKRQRKTCSKKCSKTYVRVYDRLMKNREKIEKQYLAMIAKTKK